jgi:hypothetical protein
MLYSEIKDKNLWARLRTPYPLSFFEDLLKTFTGYW